MDIIADAITKIRNGQKAKQESVTIIGNKLLNKMCKILKREGYIEEFHSNTKEKKNLIDITLKYNERGEPVISNISRISRPSRRVYSSANNIPRIANGFATVVMSTPKGILTGKEAKEKKVGGEVVGYVL